MEQRREYESEETDLDLVIAESNDLTRRLSELMEDLRRKFLDASGAALVMLLVAVGIAWLYLSPPDNGLAVEAHHVLPSLLIITLFAAISVASYAFKLMALRNLAAFTLLRQAEAAELFWSSPFEVEAS